MKSFVATLALGATLVAAEPVRFHVEYVSGDIPWKCDPCKGYMTIDSERIQVVSDEKLHRPNVLTIPIASVKTATASTRRQGKGVKEYVTIAVQIAASAGALVFRVDEHMADDIAAKILLAKK